MGFEKGTTTWKGREVLLLGRVFDMALIESLIQYSGRVVVEDPQVVWQRGRYLVLC